MGKLTDDQRQTIATRLPNESATKLAEEFDVSRQTIYRAAAAAEKFETQQTGTFVEMGTTGLKRFGGQVQEDYHRAWRSLTSMVPLVKEMLDHPIIGATVFAIEMAIRGAEYSVTPAGETPADEAAAQFLEECLDDMSHTLDDHIAQTMSMVSYGFAPFEIVYKRRLGMERDPDSMFDDGRIGWRKFAFRAQDSLAAGNEWSFDDNGGIQAMNQQAPPTYTLKSIPVDKLLLYRTTAAKNNPQGRSALRPAYYSYYFSKNFAEIEGISAERMGGGLPVMYLGTGTNTGPGSNTDLAFAKQIVRDVRTDEQGGVVIPHPYMTNDGRGVRFELLSPNSRTTVDMDKIINRYNQQMSQTLLAQFIFLGMSQVGTQALASELVGFFQESLNGWSSSIADTFNRYAVPRLFRLNSFDGLSGFPKLAIARISDVDVEKFMNALNLAVGAGVLEPDEGTERTVRDLLNLPQRDTAEGGQLMKDINPPEPKPPVVVMPPQPPVPPEEPMPPEDAMTYDQLSAWANEAIEENRRGGFFGKLFRRG